MRKEIFFKKKKEKFALNSKNGKDINLDIKQKSSLEEDSNFFDRLTFKEKPILNSIPLRIENVNFKKKTETNLSLSIQTLKSTLSPERPKMKTQPFELEDPEIFNENNSKPIILGSRFKQQKKNQFNLHSKNKFKSEKIMVPTTCKNQNLTGNFFRSQNKI